MTKFLKHFNDSPKILFITSYHICIICVHHYFIVYVVGLNYLRYVSHFVWRSVISIFTNSLFMFSLIYVPCRKPVWSSCISFCMFFLYSVTYTFCQYFVIGEWLDASFFFLARVYLHSPLAIIKLLPYGVKVIGIWIHMNSSQHWWNMF